MKITKETYYNGIGLERVHATRVDRRPKKMRNRRRKKREGIHNMSEQYMGFNFTI